MAIQKYNSLDIKAGTAQEEYLLQALANLGQRYNIKGDGFDVRSISFREVLSILYSEHSETINGYDIALVGKDDNDDKYIIKMFNTASPDGPGEPLGEPFSLEDLQTEENSESVIKYMICSLIESDESIEYVYVPLDYVFEYVYNTNNKSQIYFNSKDLIIRFVPTSDLETIFRLTSENALTCVTDDVEKISFYKYSVEYDEEHNKIDHIDVWHSYDLPFIDEAGYWVVNGFETEIYARGKDAGNPNIIVVDSTETSENWPTIIHMADENYFREIGLSWSESELIDIKVPFIVDLQNDETYNGAYAKCKFYVPSIADVTEEREEEVKGKLKYSIVISIAPGSEVECSDNIKDIYNAYDKISSFWVFNEDNDNFECIKTDGSAIDFNYMSNMDSLVKWAVENHIPADPDNYLHSFLVFDAVKNQYKNTGEPVSVYPVVHNKVYGNEFENKFNIAIEYVDKINGELYDDADDREVNGASTYNKIESIEHDNRRYHLDDWINSPGERVSNALYNRDDSTNYLEYLPNVSTYSVPVLDLAEVLVKDNTVLNRTNIMSLDASGTPYYAYLGTDYTSSDKSVLVLGTAEHDINIGTHTMTEDIGRNSFNEHRELDINFNNTRLSAYAYVCNDAIFEKDTITYRTNWTKHIIDDTTYWNTIYRPIGKFGSSVTLQPSNSATATIEPIDESSMFVKCSINDKYTTTSSIESFSIGDAVSIKCLTKAMMPQIAFDDIKEMTSNKEVIKVDDSYSLLKVSSAFSTEENYASKIYTGMPLNITYYESDGIHVNIEEDKTFSSFGMLFRLKTEYTTPTEP